MTFLFSALMIAAYLWLFVTFLKRTFLAVAPARHQLSGAIFLFNDCLFVLPAILLVPLVGPENIRILFYVTSDSVPLVNAIILFSLIAFVISLAAISRYCGRLLFYDLRRVYDELQRPEIEARVLAFNRIMMISIPLAIAVNLLVFGGSHALFSATFYDLKAGVIRHMNESSAFVAYVKHYFHVITLLMAPCLVLPMYRKRRIERWLALTLVFVALTAHGSKSPFIFFLIVLLFAYIEKSAVTRQGVVTGSLLTPKRIVIMSFGLIGLFGLFYFLATQFFLGENSRFWDYFWNRTFVGQMAGVYEQFNLLIFNPAFFWHGVPFASFFVDYPNFHKELMLVSENRYNPDTIGIKITFFAAEAYGMFGWLGVIFAPLFLACQFVVSFLVLNLVIDRLILRSRELSKYVSAFFFASYFSMTDGISEMLLYKGVILVLILMSPVVLCMALRGTWMTWQRSMRPASSRGLGSTNMHGEVARG